MGCMRKINKATTLVILCTSLLACSELESDCLPALGSPGGNSGEADDGDTGTASTTSGPEAEVYEWSFTNTNADDIAEDELWAWAMEVDYAPSEAFMFVEGTDPGVGGVGSMGRIAVCAPATAMESYAEEAPKREQAKEHLFEQGAWLHAHDVWEEFTVPGDISFFTASTDSFGDYAWTISYPNARSADTKSAISLYPNNSDLTRETTVTSERFVVRVAATREAACGF